MVRNDPRIKRPTTTPTKRIDPRLFSRNERTSFSRSPSQLKQSLEIDYANSFSNVEEARKFINSLDPSVRSSSGLDNSFIQRKQNELVNQVDVFIREAQRNLEEAKRQQLKLDDAGKIKKADKELAKQKRFRLEVRELRNFKNEIKQGKIYDPKKIQGFASEVGSRAESKLKNEVRNKTSLQSNKKLTTNNLRLVDSKGNVKTVVVYVDKKGQVSTSNVADNKLLKDYQKATGTNNLNDVVRISDNIKDQVKNANVRSKLVKQAVKGQDRAKDLFNKGFNSREVTYILAAREGSAESLKALEKQNVDFSKFFNKLEQKGVAGDRQAINNAYKVAVNQELKSAKLKPIDYKSSISEFRKQYDKLLGNRIILAPSKKSKKKNNLLELKTLSPSVKQQLQQKQTTTTEIKNFLRLENIELNKQRTSGINFELKGSEAVKRLLKGERIVNSDVLGTLVIDNKGNVRGLTEKEIKEFESQKISLNPFNAVTSSVLIGSGFRNFMSLPLEKKKQSLLRGFKSLVTNPDAVFIEMLKDPFGTFAGGSVTNAFLKAPWKVSKVTYGTVKKIKVDRLTQINKRIKELESIGIKKVDRSLYGQELRLLLDERKIIETDLLSLNKILENSIKPKNKKDLQSKSKVIKSASNDLKKGKSKRSSVAKKNRNLTKKKKKKVQKLNSATISKKLDELFKDTPSRTTKVKAEKLNLELRTTEQLLKDLYYSNGTKFKKLKKELLDQGLIVKVKVLKNKITNPFNNKLVFDVKVFLVKKKSPKGQKKKTSKTSKKITLPKESTKKTKKQKSDEKFRKGQEETRKAEAEARFLRELENNRLPKSKGVGFFKSKKAQAQLFRTFRKKKDTSSKAVKEIKKRQVNLGGQYRSLNKKSKNLNTPKQRKAFNDFRSNFNKRVAKTKQDIKLRQKEINKVLELLVKASKVSTLIAQGLKPTQAILQAQLLSLKETQELLNTYQPTTPPKPKTNNNIGKGNIKTVKKSSTKKKPLPRLPRTTSKKSFKSGSTPPKPKQKPRVRLPKLGDKSLVNKVVKVEAQYRERKNPKKNVSKSNPVVTKTLNLRTTPNKALNRVAKLADNKLVRSVQTKVVAVTNKKQRDQALDKKLLNKFREKRTKNTLKLVEKREHIADTKTEVRELRVTRKIKKNVVSKKKPKAVTKPKKKATKKKTNKNVVSKPNARKVFKSKKAAQLKGYAVYKVKGGYKRRKV